MTQLTQPAEQSADDLQILFPARQIIIGGEEIEIKEYSLLQQLQHRDKFVPFVDDLRASLSAGDELTIDRLMDVLASHYDDVFALIALAIDKPVAFVRDLTGEDADNLLLMWWTVNSDFFTRLAVRPMLEALARQNAQTLATANATLAGARSSNT